MVYLNSASKRRKSSAFEVGQSLYVGANYYQDHRKIGYCLTNDANQLPAHLINCNKNML
jgi:hypothetical protein